MVRVNKNTQILQLSNYANQDKFIFFLYFMFFVLKPFYFWSSGLPQISDIIMVFLAIAYLFKKKFAINFFPQSKGFLFIGMIFITYVVLANLVWVLILNTSDRFIVNSLFYVYNFIVAVLVIALYTDYQNKIIEITYKAALVSIFVQVIMFILSGGFTGGRMVGGFNNPNQLGYYCLLMISILLYSSNRLTIKVKWFVLGIFSSLLLVFASLSRSAIVCCILLLIFFILSKNKNKKFKWNFNTIVIIFATTIMFVNLFSNNIQNNDLLQTVQMRLNSIGEDSDDSLEGRGYDRLLEHPEYWILGAGEGAYSRFSNINMEFHSTLGNIQVSYGIIGLLLFLRILYIAVKNNNFYQSWYIIFFILVYGLSHNGIRNSLLWILLALLSIKIVPISKKGEHYD